MDDNRAYIKHWVHDDRTYLVCFTLSGWWQNVCCTLQRQWSWKTEGGRYKVANAVGSVIWSFQLKKAFPRKFRRDHFVSAASWSVLTTHHAKRRGAVVPGNEKERAKVLGPQADGILLSKKISRFAEDSHWFYVRLYECIMICFPNARYLFFCATAGQTRGRQRPWERGGCKAVGATGVGRQGVLRGWGCKGRRRRVSETWNTAVQNDQEIRLMLRKRKVECESRH